MMRFVLLALLVIVAISNSWDNNFGVTKLALFFFSYGILFETFFYFKVTRYHPHTPFSESVSDPLLSMTRSALYPYLVKNDIQLITELLSLPQNKFILQKANILEKEIQLLPVKKEELLRFSQDLVKRNKGIFITSMDLFASYILLSEPQTKLLFQKQLKTEEFSDLVSWAKIANTFEEHPSDLRIHYNGGGIGELLIYGWTPETKNYTKDLTMEAVSKRPVLFGRNDDYKELTNSLSQTNGTNSAILVGEPGVGKDSLIKALAFDSYVGNLHASLNHRRILQLMLGPLIAGASDRGTLEVRLQAIIEEVSHSGNVMLYIPDFQNIIGGSSYNLDLSGALLPYLRNGKLPIVATMTLGNYKIYLEKSPLREVFSAVKIEPPSVETALHMLFEKAAEIENVNKVHITYKAAETAVNLANKYLTDFVLPGSAVRLLSDVSHSVALAKKIFITEEDITSYVQQKTNIPVAQPSGEEKQTLLNLEQKLHERVIDQVEAITMISEAMRRLRTGLASQTKPISFLFLGPTGVGKTETAKALASLYYGGESSMIRLDMSEYADETGFKRLLGAAPGEGEERGELTDKIHDHPASLVLLDEFEKANKRILDLFLQVFEDGRLTDNKGRTVSFVNAIIIATSNAASEFIRQEVKKGTAIDKTFQTQLLDHLQTQALFKPELLNRFDGVVTFKPLGKTQLSEITKLLLKSVSKKLLEQDITVSFDDKTIEKIIAEGSDDQFGARPLRRYIQDNIEDILSQKLLKDEIKRGNNVQFSVDSSNNFQLTVA